MPRAKGRSSNAGSTNTRKVKPARGTTGINASGQTFPNSNKQTMMYHPVGAKNKQPKGVY